MSSALFELDQFDRLPLWAQVLMASRLVRRVAMTIPDDPAATSAEADSGTASNAAGKSGKGKGKGGGKDEAKSKPGKKSAGADVAQVRATLLAGCDGLDFAAMIGQVSRDVDPALRKADSAQPPAAGRDGRYSAAAAACTAIHWAIDAARAAEASMDFSAAEAACSNSTAQAFRAASEAPDFGPLRVQILLAADLDSLRFACGEFKVGRYDGVTREVMGRLTAI